MTTLFDYLLWRGDLPLAADPINEVDGVILARLSYMPFERILERESTQPITVEETARRLLALPDIETAVRRRGDTDLLRALAESPRFGRMALSAYADHLDSESQTQFSAITVALEPEHTAVIYRGTDNTLIGWKEDFNMGFVCPVPGQLLAVDYLQRAAERFSGRLTVCGHSKGGNFAVYAAAFCGETVQRRIGTVYNFDGPGFDGTVLTQEGYRRVCDRIQTYVPQSSVVGMLLGHEERYTIVHSEQTFLQQHDTYSWEVQRKGFHCMDTVDNSSRFVDYTLKAWLAEMTPAQREQFVDAIYEVMRQTNAHTLRQMNENWFASATSMLHSAKNMDEETRRAVTHALGLLVRAARDGLYHVVQDQQESDKPQN